MMLDLSLGIPTRQSELDLPPSDDVRINETASVMRAADDGIELVSMNFSFPPRALGASRYSISSPRDGSTKLATVASFLRQPSSNSTARNI